MRVAKGMGPAAMVVDSRPVERLRHHFEVERELADRLRRSTAEERARGLYAEVYDELFRRVPDHPQNLKKGSADRAELDARLAVLRVYLRPEHRFLEIGAGDCALAFRVAPLVREAVAVEVSDLISAAAADRPANFRLVLTDGVRLPLADASVDVAYSFQVMEHLHPDDAAAQLRELRRVLRPGGVYLCVTPSRLTGPHDISASFGEEVAGFHLCEYAHADLAAMLREAGFASVRAVLSKGGRVLAELPTAPLTALERLLERAPRPVRRALRRSALAHKLLGVCVAARA